MINPQPSDEKPASRTAAGDGSPAFDGLPGGDPREEFTPAAAKILAAAQRVLVAKGFSGLTLRAIAQESGENSAMVQYYFGNKAGLVRAMIDSSFRDEQQEVAAAMSTVTGEERLARFVEGLRTISSSRSFPVFFDILPHALRSEALRARLARAMDWYRRVKVDWLRRRDDEEETSPAQREALLGVAELMTAVVDGLAIQEAVDDDFDMGRAYAALEFMLERSLPELLEAGLPEAGPAAGQAVAARQAAEPKAAGRPEVARRG